MEFSMQIIISCIQAHPDNPLVQMYSLLALGEVLQPNPNPNPNPDPDPNPNPNLNCRCFRPFR